MNLSTSAKITLSIVTHINNSTLSHNGHKWFNNYYWNSFVRLGRGAKIKPLEMFMFLHFREDEIKMLTISS